MWFDPVLAYMEFRPGQEVDWSGIDLEDLFFVYGWRTGEVIRLTNKRVHEGKPEVDGRFFYYEWSLLPIVVIFKCDVRLSSLDDNVTSIREEFGDERTDPSPGGVFVEVRRLPMTTKLTDTSEICCLVCLRSMSSVLWFLLTSKVSLVVRGCRPQMMTWLYCTLRSVACVNFLR